MRTGSESRRFLPECERGPAWVVHDGELPGWPSRAFLEDLGPEVDGPLRGAVDVVDLDVRDPALASPLPRRDAGKRPGIPREHAHAAGPLRSLPTEELLVEPDGLGRLLAAIVEPHERICHRR